MKRIGIDIGGTFTDLVLYDEAAHTLTRVKALSTPGEPERGLLRAFELAGVHAEEVSVLIHGTTLVTNLIIERTGARTGLITTKGFRDTLEIMRFDRQHLYDLQWDKPTPLVPRHLRLEVDERIDHTGRIVRPLKPEAVVPVVQALVRQGVEAVAVCLLHAYANPAHEALIAAVIADVAPHLHVAFSSQVNPEIREYERTSTTVLNAYALPKVVQYVDRLDAAFMHSSSVKYVNSGGGLIASRTARQFPVQLVYSGPAAGVQASIALSQQTGLTDLITLDMGGTSCDVCLIRDGMPDMTNEVEVAWQVPIRTQAININSIGAGGGSVVWIDTGDALRVGPRSAGARPGPACYGLGGSEPTVTDANVVLGLLSRESFQGSQIALVTQPARDAIGSVASHFGTGLEDTARGIYRIVNANMAQAIREITVEKGIDPRGYTLVSFGGAGGQHAVEVAREIGMQRVLFPIFAGTLSALGMLTADFSYVALRTFLAPLTTKSLDMARQHLAALAQEAGASLQNDMGLVTGISTRFSADMRYIQQSHEITVPLTFDDLTGDTITATFETLHETLFGTRLGDALEFVNLRATVVGRVPPIALPTLAGTPRSGQLVPLRYAATALHAAPLPVYRRADLTPQDAIAAPCLIEDSDSSLYIPEHCRVTMDAYGNVQVSISTAH